MNKQFANEEVWEPISDWGRDFKAYMANKNVVAKPVKPPEAGKTTRSTCTKSHSPCNGSNQAGRCPPPLH